MAWIRQLLSFALTLLLSGCATSPIDFSKAKAIPQEEAVVFGRVDIIHKNEPKVWGKLSSSGVFYVLVLSHGSSEAFSHTLREDGSFSWHLPPGSYAISGFQWTGVIGHGTLSGRIFAEFVVTKDKPLIYIGKLTLYFDGTYRYTMHVEDDYERAIQNFKNKFPEIKGEPIQSLMKLEVLK
jgi:hypothetical protein